VSILEQVQIVVTLMEELHQKYNHLAIVMDDCSGNVFGKELIRRVLFQ
jgi:hypothetical protein